MATLISQTSSNGGTRRCDARCYNGHGARCKCICGGINHGKGLEQAAENTREMAKGLLERTDTEIAKEILTEIKDWEAKEKERMARCG